MQARFAGQAIWDAGLVEEIIQDFAKGSLQIVWGQLGEDLEKIRVGCRQNVVREEEINLGLNTPNI